MKPELLRVGIQFFEAVFVAFFFLLLLLLLLTQMAVNHGSYGLKLTCNL